MPDIEHFVLYRAKMMKLVFSDTSMLIYNRSSRILC